MVATETILRDYYAHPDPVHVLYPVTAATTIHKGTLIGDNGSGYARPLVAGDPFLGVANETIVNAGADGEEEVRVRSQGVMEEEAAVGVTGVGDVGTAAYGAADDTVTLTVGTNTLIGKIFKHISGTRCLVFFQATTLRVA